MPALQQVAAVMRRYPRTYRTSRAMVLRARAALPPRNVPGVPGPVHRNDLMYEPGVAGAGEAYVHVGRSAVAACEQSLTAVGRTWDDVGSALDFGCGHGRVARHLAAALPARGASRLTVTDLDAEAVRFVAAQFSARGVISVGPMAELAIGRHDLVWAGSVATHLPEASWLAWIDLVARSLVPGGLFVFSSHAPECVDRDFNEEWVQARLSLRSGLEQSGYAYVPYSYSSAGEYGLAAQTTDRLDRDLFAVGLRRVLHLPSGWEYQDVHAFERPSG